MRIYALGVVLLAIIALGNAKWIEENDDSKMEHLHNSILQRAFFDKYLSLESRETPEFTEDQRRFQNDSLEAHNILRARHCAPPLVLDDEINVRAQEFAEVLASNDSHLYHSTNRMGLYGENLYSLTRASRINFADAFKATNAWYSEVSRYDYDTPGYRPNIAHFSQIVWKNSKRLGVGYAYAKEGRKLYVAAQYGPPGNYGFAFAENVLPPSCEA